MSDITVDLVREKMKSILANLLQVEFDLIELNDDDDFITKLNIDSLDAVNLTIEISEEFNVFFGEEIEDIDSLSTFGSLITLIAKRSAKKDL